MTRTLTGYGKWTNNLTHRWQILPSATLRQRDSPTHTCFKQHFMECTNGTPAFLKKKIYIFFFTFVTFLLVTHTFLSHCGFLDTVQTTLTKSYCITLVLML